MVGGEAQFTAIDQRRGESVDRLVAEQTAGLMASLRPGIRKQHERALDTCRREAPQQHSRIVCKNPHALGKSAGDGRDDARRDAVDKGLAADQPNLGISARLTEQMLAMTEADFEPDAPARWIEREARVYVRFVVGGQSQRHAIEMLRKRRPPSRSQWPASPPAVKAWIIAGRRTRPCALRALIPRQRQPKTPRNSSTKSVASQEKPPSGSGVRPKCP